MKTLGEKIRELRRKKGLSQEDLSFEIGISRQTVSKWESDSMQPTTDNIRALCEFFDVTAEYFIGEEKLADTTVTETTANTSTTPAPESVATKVSSTDVVPYNDTVAIKTYSKKKILVFSLLISLAAVIFVASAIVGGIAIFIATMPKAGAYEMHVLNADVLAIVCVIFAAVALATVITMTILLKRDKKHKMSSFVDKMQTKDDRQ